MHRCLSTVCVRRASDAEVNPRQGNRPLSPMTLRVNREWTNRMYLWTSNLVGKIVRQSTVKIPVFKTRFGFFGGKFVASGLF